MRHYLMIAQEAQFKKNCLQTSHHLVNSPVICYTVMMIDLHSHILPGIDDGPADWEETVELCRIAAKDGVRGIVATPHIIPGVYPNTGDIISTKITELRERLKGRVDITLYTGAEVHLAPDLVEKVGSDEVPTINNGCYLLLELPHSLLPPQTEGMIFKLRTAGIFPIITHVERCAWAKAEFERIEMFVRMGALIQITGMSVTGGFGKMAKAVAEKLLKEDLAHVIASDAHSQGQRPTGLSRAVEATSKLIGQDRAMKMVRENPLKIINSEMVLQD